MSDAIYETSLCYIKDSYLHGVLSAVKLDTDFYKILSQDQKSRLVFIVLRNYYDKFMFFFVDLELDLLFTKNFVRKMLVNMDCQIF